MSSAWPVLVLLVCMRVCGALEIFWNVPSYQCQPAVRLNVTRFGIRQNSDDAFFGGQLNLLYSPGEFPRFLTSGGQVNGGIPQRGDLNRHLLTLQTDIQNRIPIDYAGPAVIDFEDWQPTLSSTGHVIYRNMSNNYFRHVSRHRKQRRADGGRSSSRSIKKKKNSGKHKRFGAKNAAQMFEKAARSFLEESLKLATQVRPRAQWGYYHYPYCKNYVPGQAACSAQLRHDNQRTRWLYANSRALFPSMYLSRGMMNAWQKFVQVGGILDEAKRMSRSVGGRPIYAYTWFGYHDDWNGKQPLPDLVATMLPIAWQRLEGLIIWGASRNVENAQVCRQLERYVDNTLGPFVRWLTQLNGSAIDDLHRHLSASRESFDSTVGRIGAGLQMNSQHFLMS